MTSSRRNQTCACDLEGRRLVRAGQRAGEAVHARPRTTTSRSVRSTAPTAGGSGTKRVCSIDGEQVAYDDIAKGYETEDGQMVVLTDEDLAELPVSSSREIAVEKFVPADQIDPMLLEKSYYLEPEKAAAKPYALLRDALKAADRMASSPCRIRTRMTVAVLRVRDDVIVLQTHAVAGRGPRSRVRQPRRRRERRQAGRARRWPTCWWSPWPGTTTRASSRTTTQQAVEAVVRAKLEGGEVTAGRRSPPRTAPARWSTCSPRCSAASSGPRPPAASPPGGRGR